LKIYLDVSCLNRPFDDESQARIRLEAEAIRLIVERIDAGEWQHVSSDAAVLETEAIPDSDRRERVRLLLPKDEDILDLNEDVANRGDRPSARPFIR
jgi:hypothetical protein